MAVKKPVQITLEEKPYHEYSFVILHEDFHKSQKCLRDIFTLVGKSKPIPAALINELGSYLYDKETVIRELKKSELKKISEETIRFFAANKDYQFEANRYDQIENKNIAFNFSSSIEHTLVHYWANTWFIKKIGKENDLLYLIRFLYQVLKEYTAPFDPNPDKPLISDYKKIVISAYLCEQLGYYIPHDDEKKPLIPDYYKVGRYVIRKQNEIKNPPKKRLPKR